MATFKEANQVRAALKMKLSFFSWYNSSGVNSGDGDYFIVIHVKKLDNFVRKQIPPVIDGVTVKTELE
jgi:hypothetical protein